MADLQLTRLHEIGDDLWKEIEEHVKSHWVDASETRRDMIESDYQKWERVFWAKPFQEVRNFPWPNSSNLVVPLTQIFVETLNARTLMLIYGTRPLFKLDGFPRELQDDVEMYLNRKAEYEWDMYQLTDEMCSKGLRTGTAMVKTVWHFDRSIYFDGTAGVDTQEQTVTHYEGPRSRVIPFMDFFVSPITAERMEDVDMIFHRRRLSEHRARRLIQAGKWRVTPEELETMLQRLDKDATRAAQLSDAHMNVRSQREFKPVEVYFEYELRGKWFKLVAILESVTLKLVDLYYYPYTHNLPIFVGHRPTPRDGLFYGVSKCETLSSIQEETSTIHNDRRNNSYLANAPFIKRRSGSLIPDLDAGFYPGKIWDLEDMNDFEVIALGRNYNDMLGEEQYNWQIAERLTGASAPQQGLSQGQSGKRGIYNTTGTLAVMAESNTRQDVYTKRVRSDLGLIGRTSLAMQVAYGLDGDPTIDAFPVEVQARLKNALRELTTPRILRAHFEVKASNAAFNTEAYKQSLLNMMGVLTNYSDRVMGMSAQLANPQINPSLRLVMNDIVRMHKWMAERILHAFGEYDLEGVLPDALAAIEATIPGGSRGTSPEGGSEQPESGGAPNSGEGLNGDRLRELSQMATLTPEEIGA